MDFYVIIFVFDLYDLKGWQKEMPGMLLLDRGISNKAGKFWGTVDRQTRYTTRLTHGPLI